ncbi:kremen protein 2 [Leptodactylus fuscus]|uniref:kremen protein 2 n=1 Tax=Leptodactylus fuscus TaxID=238119 RepID=UPI003F4E7B15
MTSFVSSSDLSECFTVNGRDYRGSVNYAGPEKTPCLYWNQTIQHRYNTQSDPSGELGLGNHNHCRNPDADVQPWCYVSETEDGVYWKYCDIPSCHMPGYVGCFVDRGFPPALSGASGTSKKLTIQTCIQFCRRKGLEYAGVEAGYACFCGSSSDVAALQMVSSSQCDQVCFGRSDELCGGDGKMSVYSVWVGTCHGNFSSTTGVLYSPDFPDEYSVDRSCFWDIFLPGTKAIHLQFKSFQIPDPNDVLRLKDGDSGHLLLQIPGGQEPPNNVTFQTDHLQITFQSDHELSGAGYVIVYRGLGTLTSSVAPYSRTTSTSVREESPARQSNSEQQSPRNGECRSEQQISGEVVVSAGLSGSKGLDAARLAPLGRKLVCSAPRHWIFDVELPNLWSLRAISGTELQSFVLLHAVQTPEGTERRPHQCQPVHEVTVILQEHSSAGSEWSGLWNILLQDQKGRGCGAFPCKAKELSTNLREKVAELNKPGKGSKEISKELLMPLSRVHTVSNKRKLRGNNQTGQGDQPICPTQLPGCKDRPRHKISRNPGVSEIYQCDFYKMHNKEEPEEKWVAWWSCQKKAITDATKMLPSIRQTAQTQASKLLEQGDVER